MKKNLLKFGVGLLSVVALAGCGNNGNGGDKHDKISAAEFKIAIEYVATTVPLALDMVKGNPVLTNKSRDAEQLPIPELKEGNNLKLVKSGKLNYEDEANNVYLYPNYSVEWSFLVTETHAKFEFQEKDDYLVAVPDYPRYLAGGEVPAKVAGRLYANVKIGSFSEKINIDVVLVPQEIVEEFTLQEVRAEAAPNQVIKIRGYVHGVFADLDAAGIADGEWGLGLYKVTAFAEELKVGNLVEAIGGFTTYNGLTQIQWIKSITVLNPEFFPEIEKPTLKSYAMDDLYEIVVSGLPGIGTTLFGRDNSLVTFDGAFKFLRIEDKDGKNVGFDGFATTGNTHINVILEGTDSTGFKFPVPVYVNYHMGEANRVALRDWMQANQTKDIYYSGPIGAYNKLTLAPYEFAGHFANTPFAV